MVCRIVVVVVVVLVLVLLLVLVVVVSLVVGVAELSAQRALPKARQPLGLKGKHIHKH